MNTEDKYSSSQQLNKELEVLDSCSCKNDGKWYKWYDRVYLCYDNNILNTNRINRGIIGKFDCYRYSSFTNANNGWYNERKELHKFDLRHTMIPICKWVPQILDRYILHWKLKNIYWKGDICIINDRNTLPKEK